MYECCEVDPRAAEEYRPQVGDEAVVEEMRFGCFFVTGWEVAKVHPRRIADQEVEFAFGIEQHYVRARQIVLREVAGVL